MKHNLIALILALGIVSWAQTATQSIPSAPPQSATTVDAKACPCCDKAGAAETKDSHACCAHHAMAAADGKEAGCCAGKDKASCCSGKDGKSCKRDGDPKTTAACCSGEKCAKECEKGLLRGQGR